MHLIFDRVAGICYAGMHLGCGGQLASLILYVTGLKRLSQNPEVAAELTPEELATISQLPGELLLSSTVYFVMIGLGVIAGIGIVMSKKWAHYLAIALLAFQIPVMILWTDWEVLLLALGAIYCLVRVCGWYGPVPE